MPRGNRTGPDGMGPRTGRGMGFCNGYDRPGFADSGRGFGSGGGRGMGFGRGFGRAAAYNPRGMLRPRFAGLAQETEKPYTQQTKEQEIQMLEQESKAIEEEQQALDQEKEQVNKMLEELRSEGQ